ncbi:UNVERIFIED_CONTAM: hypothetical protein Slati_3704000 [Sesamum latifolium]|uniref:Endonuclease/exonuclease/phosphatase domain-containing protein n=1 Tax=Sesamum latifolium TaxID=2727402 RepID=A0AAW2U2Y2_9LAMI
MDDSQGPVSKTSSTYTKRVDRLKEHLNYNGIGIDSHGKGGGLMLLWRKDTEVWLQSYSEHHIDAIVSCKDNTTQWCFSGFYGHPETSNRKGTWDFNEILSTNEKERQTQPAQWQIHDFRQILIDCELQDMGFHGNLWCNNKEELHTVRARLDRACCMTSWANLFPTRQVVHEVTAASDHSFLWVELELNIQAAESRNERLFRFEAIWTKEESCHEVIRSCWQTTSKKNSQVDIISCIKNYWVSLLEWNNNCFGNIVHQMKVLEKRICDLKLGTLIEAPQREMEEAKDKFELLSI